MRVLAFLAFLTVALGCGKGSSSPPLPAPLTAKNLRQVVATVGPARVEPDEIVEVTTPIIASPAFQTEFADAGPGSQNSYERVDQLIRAIVAHSKMAFDGGDRKAGLAYLAAAVTVLKQVLALGDKIIQAPVTGGQDLMVRAERARRLSELQARTFQPILDGLTKLPQHVTIYDSVQMVIERAKTGHVKDKALDGEILFLLKNKKYRKIIDGYWYGRAFNELVSIDRTLKTLEP